MSEPIYTNDTPGYTAGPPAGSGTLLGHFWISLRRQWLIVLATTILAVGAGVAYLYLQPPTFASKSRMWVRGKIRLADIGQYTEDLQHFFGTQINLLLSGQIQNRALARLRTTHPQLTIPQDSAGNPILPEIRVTQVPKSAVLDLQAKGRPPEFVRAYLNALMEEFLAYKREVRKATSGDALTSVSDQVVEQERRLQEELQRLATFQRENNVALLEETVRGGGGHLAQLQAQLSLHKLELQLLEAAAKEQESGVAATNLLGSAPDPTRLPGLSSTVPLLPNDFVAAQQQVAALKLRREQLSRYLRPKHPKIVELDEEIARAEGIVEFVRSRVRDQFATAGEALKLRIKSIETTVAELADKVGSANRKLAEFESIRANIQRQQELHDRLLSLLQGVDMTSSMDQENVVVLQPATVPVLANHSPFVVLPPLFLLGVGLGLGIIFLRARSDDRCESLDEVRVWFAEGVFGQIPEVKSKNGNGRPPILEIQDKRHVFAESCRNLRSSLLFGAKAEEPPKVILVTSASPDEGKSTIATNLARTLALGGARVLLIDADLRRGHLHELAGVPAEPGLADWQKGECDLKEYVRETSLPNLFILPRGTPRWDTSELFLSPAFDALVRSAREQFDYTIIDSIPVFAADDTTTLAPKTDAVLFVVRRAHTSARAAHEALDLLYQRNVRVLGLVFNRADSNSAAYRYYRHKEYHHTTAE